MCTVSTIKLNITPLTQGKFLGADVNIFLSVIKKDVLCSMSSC